MTYIIENTDGRSSPPMSWVFVVNDTAFIGMRTWQCCVVHCVYWGSGFETFCTWDCDPPFLFAMYCPLPWSLQKLRLETIICPKKHGCFCWFTAYFGQNRYVICALTWATTENSNFWNYLLSSSIYALAVANASLHCRHSEILADSI